MNLYFDEPERKMNEQMIENLKKLAAQKVWADEDHFPADVLSRRDFHEGVIGGFESGETALARIILNSLGVEW